MLLGEWRVKLPFLGGLLLCKKQTCELCGKRSLEHESSTLLVRRTDKSDANDLQDNKAVRDKAIGLLLFACLGFDAYNAVFGII